MRDTERFLRASVLRKYRQLLGGMPAHAYYGLQTKGQDDKQFRVPTKSAESCIMEPRKVRITVTMAHTEH